MKFSLKKISKKGAVFGVSAGVALGLTGAALAYFTSTGSGTGSGAVGTATNDITVVGTVAAPLFPGGPGQTVNFTASNGAVQPERLSAIHLVSVSTSIAGCTTTGLTPVATFTMSDVTVNTTLAAGASGVALTPTGTMLFLDSGANQNVCEGAILTLTLTTS
jgi:hypothetical protein